MVYISITFALSTATTVRVGYHLGRKDKLKANITSKLALLLGGLSMCLSSYIVYTMSTSLSHLFTNDIDITYRIINLAYLVSGFQLAYGFHGCAQGVLRATGRQSQLALLSLISLWLVGLPTSLYLAFVSRPTFGLTGFWIGLCTGMSLLAIALVCKL
jgi:MATE family multidrug resistance protein